MAATRDLSNTTSTGMAHIVNHEHLGKTRYRTTVDLYMNTQAGLPVLELYQWKSWPQESVGGGNPYRVHVFVVMSVALRLV